MFLSLCAKQKIFNEIFMDYGTCRNAENVSTNNCHCSVHQYPTYILGTYMYIPTLWA